MQHIVLCGLGLLVLLCIHRSLGTEDYYSTLGVRRDATEAEIKKAFRALALKYHPDKNQDPGAQDKFKEISLAYDILSHPDKRKHYDTFGTAADAGGGSPFTGGFGGFSGFNTGGGGGGGGATFTFDLNDIFRNINLKEGKTQTFHFTNGGFQPRGQQQSQQGQGTFDFQDIFQEDHDPFGSFFGEDLHRFGSGEHHGFGGGDHRGFGGDNHRRFGSRDPHRFGSGDSFFGTHFGQDPPVYEQSRSHSQFSHQERSCRTVTQRVGNMVTTYTQCS